MANKGNNTNGGAPTTAQLLDQEKKARANWYAHFNGGAPVKPFTPAQRASLRALETAKAALVRATGAANFKEAAASLNYKPQYAPRTNNKSK